MSFFFFFFFQAEDGIRDYKVTGVQTCALPISDRLPRPGGEIGEGRDERRGQIVDAEKAHVLETLDRVALAGTAEPGDEDEGQALVHGADARTRRLPHRLRGWSLRWCEGTMPSSSRYFATVRLAIVRPRPLRIPATSWSDRGLTASSFARRSWIIFFTETEETISPSPEAMPLWKKNLSSNSPWGV